MGGGDGLDTPGEEWVGSRCVLNLELTGFANELGVEDDRKDSRVSPYFVDVLGCPLLRFL